jgi:dihydroflavonol-4-reductase
VDAGLAAVIVNPAVIIGPRDVNQLGGSLILEAAKGHLRFSPPGGVNFVAVDDVVAGHLAAAERGQTGERYILAGQNLYFQAAATIVCRVVGRPPPSIVVPEWILPFIAAGVTAARPILGNRLPVDATQLQLSTETIFVDSSRTVDALGLTQTPFKTAVEQAYQWYKQNGYLAAG